MSIFQSIWSDVQRQLQYGNMVTQLIIVNAAVFIGVHLLDLIFGHRGQRFGPGLAGHADDRT